MGLTSSLMIGRSGLMSSQAAIEVAGNNLANATNPAYHRQVANLTGMGVREIGQGMFVGRGVQLESITRVIDEALERRLRNAISDQAGTQARQEYLQRIEAIHNEFTDVDLSSHLNQFFNSWSELANRPEDLSLRSLVVAEGMKLGAYIQRQYQSLIDTREQLDASITQSGARVADILDQLAALNKSIVAAESGRGGAHDLRDERDRLMTELAGYIDITTVEQANGVIDIHVGSTPILLNGNNRGFEVRRETIDGDLSISLHIKADGTELRPASGRLGALIQAREHDIGDAMEKLDKLAHELIYEVNRIHTGGQGMQGHTSLTGTNRVLDTSLPLNDPEAGLGFEPTHGSFLIHVTQKSSSHRSTVQIPVDLDGIGADTSLDGLAAYITANVDHLTAAVTSDGRLRMQTSSGDFEVSFSDDSSGVLAALGVNTFFTGSSARDMDVRADLQGNLRLLNAGQEHLAGDNRNAFAIEGIRDRAMDRLDGLSVTQFWSRHVEDLAVKLGQANQRLESDRIVTENLTNQRNSYSGVNIDEEAINLLTFQRAYQGSARFISVIDEMFQTLLGLV
ncbi:MAG: flagellar hook-associated protein FlgK [Phycisphaeraceae bacterium]|nr:flagellar hook-associated protein FlgK [Phycisphaeraceae bacterium]